MFYTITGVLSEDKVLTLPPAVTAEGEGVTVLRIQIPDTVQFSSVQFGFEFPSGLNRRNARLTPFLYRKDTYLEYNIPPSILSHAGRIYVQIIAVTDGQVWRTPMSVNASFLCTESVSEVADLPIIKEDILSEVRLMCADINEKSLAINAFLEEVRTEFVIEETPTHNSKKLVCSGGIASALDTKQDCGDYATTLALAQGLETKQALGNYATQTALSQGLSTKQALGNYATQEALEQGLATKQNSGSYATTTALTQNVQTLLNKINELKSLQKIYISTVNVSPASVYGGDWRKITDNAYLKIVSSGAGSCSGTSSSHVIPVSSMPRHEHSATVSNAGGGSSACKTWLGGVTNGAVQTTGTSGDNYSYYPWYYGIYVWERIA